MKRATTSICLNPMLLEEIRKEAKKNKVTITSFIEEIILRDLSEHNKQVAKIREAMIELGQIERR